MARKESCEEDIQSSPLVAATLLPLVPYVTLLSRPRNPLRQADRDLQLGRQVLRRDGHAPSGAGGVRAGRRLARFVGQLPWLHLRQHRAPLGDAESQVFESTTAAKAAAGLASDSSL